MVQLVARGRPTGEPACVGGAPGDDVVEHECHNIHRSPPTSAPAIKALSSSIFDAQDSRVTAWDRVNRGPAAPDCNKPSILAMNSAGPLAIATSPSSLLTSGIAVETTGTPAAR